MNSINLRHKLHQHPELSNTEFGTASRLVKYIAPLSPDKIITGIGGTGVAVCFGDAATGSTVMLRCELDALPIAETNSFDYRSINPGISHKCGHDGHMAILAAVAQYYSNNRPKAGRVILLFQPAEETGEGAKKVLEDRVSEQLKPDFVFALHNTPKYPMGEVFIKTGTICCASRGMIIRLTGKTAHAAQPETGNSPVKAVHQLLPLFEQLPALINSHSDFTFATIVGVKIGEKAFGTSPADAEIYVTLRSEHDLEMRRLVEMVNDKVIALAIEHQLAYSIESEDVFDATVNHDEAVAIITNALHNEAVHLISHPFRWSEDFGQFTSMHCGALFGLGAGEDTPALHNPDYDFPDQLIEIGSRYFIKITDHCFNHKQPAK
ncbi:amidohydrolase [Paraglaciecola sp. MB-3u-78]|jgi:amidohydrolase|uniref:amidohydrolase n=1 Tax=Paraglaciecola sp. MB-3u-78 TaxID=2058332 RepID=UPI000C3409E0|nr:amidohydrolase [Paraglaciecola sp. MB-3u-78]PKG97323.1 amidohydrolase [Paraglaciecola sp. MB-3u-78]